MANAIAFNENRRIRLRISGPAVEDGRVPISLLSDKLKALQTSLYNIANAASRTRSRRGGWKAVVKNSCQLLFVEARPGSLEIVTELPPPDGFPTEEFDLGSKSINDFRDLLSAVCNKKNELIDEHFPDTGTRARIMKSLVLVLPEDDAEYSVSVGFGTNGSECDLPASIREYLNRLALETEEELDNTCIRTLTGRLYLAEASPGAKVVGLDVDGHKIQCRYPDSLADVIPELMLTSLVEVTGRAVLDSQENVQEISEIIDIREVEIGPILMRQIRADDAVFYLRLPIQVQADYRNSLWIHEYEPLGILAYASSRRDSLKAFREDFAFLYEEIALANDQELSPAAIKLKKQFGELIEKREVAP